MSAELIRVEWGQNGSAGCVCLLIVPGRAVAEPGYIKWMHVSGATDKHEIQALAQTAYYQFQDDELDLVVTSDKILVQPPGRESDLSEDGMIMFRDGGGAIRAVVHDTADTQNLLEAANRFCTRWVRLDI